MRMDHGKLAHMQQPITRIGRGLMGTNMHRDSEHQRNLERHPLVSFVFSIWLILLMMFVDTSRHSKKRKYDGNQPTEKKRTKHHRAINAVTANRRLGDIACSPPRIASGSGRQRSASVMSINAQPSSPLLPTFIKPTASAPLGAHDRPSPSPPPSPKSAEDTRQPPIQLLIQVSTITQLQ